MINTKFYGHTSMVKDLATEFGMKLGAAENILNFMYDRLQEHLFDGDIIRIKHTCSIRLIDCPERDMYNYSADRRIHLPARRRIRIAPAKRFDDKLKEEAK